MIRHAHGAVREDGYIFKQYYINRAGNECEQWLSPGAYHRYKIAQTLGSARRNAKKHGVPFDLDGEYLLSIFPSDWSCPALRMKLHWGDNTGRSDSPSLDRIIPAKGYTRGNVRWLSQLANQIKTNATPEQVMAVAKFLNSE